MALFCKRVIFDHDASTNESRITLTKLVDVDLVARDAAASAG
jgi:hypothetical protein